MGVGQTPVEGCGCGFDCGCDVVVVLVSLPPCFFCSSQKHLEQQFPVALLPKKPHPILHNTGSAQLLLAFVVVDCSLMLIDIIWYIV